MNVYEVITRVIDTQYDGVDVRTINQSICILAENLIEVAEVVKHDEGELLAINEIAVVPGHLNSKYIVVPRTECKVDEPEPEKSEPEKSELDIIGLLDETEKLLSSAKHRMVHLLDYVLAAEVRTAQQNVRILKGEPIDLDQYFSRREKQDHSLNKQESDKPESAKILHLYDIFIEKDVWFTIGDVVELSEEVCLDVDHDKVLGFFNTKVDEGCLSCRRNQTSPDSCYLFEYRYRKSSEVVK